MPHSQEKFCAKSRTLFWLSTIAAPTFLLHQFDYRLGHGFSLYGANARAETEVLSCPNANYEAQRRIYRLDRVDQPGITLTVSSNFGRRESLCSAIIP
jgi:hypothetical protein